MKIRFFLLVFLTLFSAKAWCAQDVVVVVHKINVVNKVTLQELQDFYMGESNTYKKTTIKVKLCMNIDAKDDFFNKIELEEKEANFHKAKLLVVGRDDTVVIPRKIRTSEIMTYFSHNKTSGLCFMNKKDYDNLSSTEKDALKIVYQ